MRRIAEELRLSRYRVRRIILDQQDRRAQGMTAASWSVAETVEEQEAIVDSLLSLEEATPWDRVVYDDQQIHVTCGKS